MRKLTTLVLLLALLITGVVSAEETVTGVNVGPLPSIGYNSDTGFQYGLLANIFLYGDGKIYPDYYHNFYAEWNQTTKGGGLAQLKYDSKYLIPGIRVTADLTNTIQQAWGFFGFNGAQSTYHPEWKDETSSEYKNRLYYAMQRNYFRATVNFQGKLSGDNLRWLAGAGFMNFDIASVTTTNAWDSTFTNTRTLYNDFKDWGVISADEADGGIYTYVKTGLVYDTRDAEACPMTGLWEEALITVAPAFLGNESAFVQLSAIHRQYFTLIPEDLSLTYRLGYQGIVAGKMPFYLQGMMPNSRDLNDGLGGNKTVRGVMRARLVGDGYLYGNLEARWKAVRFKIGSMNFYAGLNPFIDAGYVVQPYDFDETGIPLSEVDDYLSGTSEKLHIGYGMGLKVAMNENIIVSVDYGIAADANDGTTGIYIGLGYLY